jgi:hypothetical protein
MREIEAHNVTGKEIVTQETMEERRQGYAWSQTANTLVPDSRQ